MPRRQTGPYSRPPPTTPLAPVWRTRCPPGTRVPLRRRARRPSRTDRTDRTVPRVQHGPSRDGPVGPPVLPHDRSVGPPATRRSAASVAPASTLRLTVTAVAAAPVRTKGSPPAGAGSVLPEIVTRSTAPVPSPSTE